MNLYDNSSIDYNKKNENKIYDLYNNILIKNSNIKIVLSLLFINRVTSKSSAVHVDN